MDGKIHIAIPAVGDYRRYAEVTAASAKRGSSLPVEVHFIDWTTISRERLDKLGSWHGSSISFSRLFLAELFPDLDWIISCDADVLFRGDIAELWKLRDDSVSIVASQDRPLPNEPHAWVAMDWYKSKGLVFKEPLGYFCDGLCLCNLRKWREIGVQAKFVELAEKYSDWPSPDQMIINYVLQQDKGLLPRNWGCFSGDQNADVDYNGNCAIHYVNDQPWARRKLTHLVSDVCLMWWREWERLELKDGAGEWNGFSVDSRWHGCRGAGNYAWRRGLWLALRATNGIWRHCTWFAWHFRNAVPRVRSPERLMKQAGKRLKLLWWTRGPNTHHTTLVNALRTQGVDVEVCYYHGRYGADRLRLGWKDPDLKPWEHYLHSIRLARRLIHDFDERLQMVAGYSDAVNWKTILWCLVRRQPWFVVTEGTSGSWKSRPVFNLFSWLVDKYALGIFPEGRLAEFQFADAGVRKEKIVPFCYATMMPGGKVKEEGQGSERNCTFVFAGELCRRKAVDVLAKAWEKVFAEYPEVKLIVAGGSAGHDFDDVATCGFDLQAFLKGPRVEYVGAVPQERIYDVIGRGDVMLLPSRYDPWGVALVEGAAAGLAMIGSDATGAAVDLIETGSNGVLVKAGDVEALAEAMKLYAANRALAREHGRMARQIAQTTSGDVLAERMIGYLEKAART